MTITIAVKNAAYRSVEIFLHRVSAVGKGRLRIDRPTCRSEVVFIEQLPNEPVLSLLPGQVDTFGQRLRRTVFPLPPALLYLFSPALPHRFPLALRPFFGPLGSGR